MDETATRWTDNGEPYVNVNLTERQARAVCNLVEQGTRAHFRGVVTRETLQAPADLLTEPEMADLQVRLLRALGEKQP